jgi:hypothetical protein
MAEKEKGEPLRDWTMQSYGVDNGRSVSSVEERGNMGNHARGKGRQIPSIKGLDRSDSGDNKRDHFAGSKL